MMTINLQTITADELLALPDQSVRRELIHGELREMAPAGHEHGHCASIIHALLFNHVRPRRLGRVYAAETGFLLATDPDTVRAPDVAFVQSERVANVRSKRGYFPGPPDLAVEVVSPNDTFSDLHDKALHWIQSGVRLVIVIDSDKRSVVTYRPSNEIRNLNLEDTLDASDVVADWRVNVAELFDE